MSKSKSNNKISGNTAAWIATGVSLLTVVGSVFVMIAMTLTSNDKMAIDASLRAIAAQRIKLEKEINSCKLPGNGKPACSAQRIADLNVRKKKMDVYIDGIIARANSNKKNK